MGTITQKQFGCSENTRCRYDNGSSVEAIRGSVIASALRRRLLQRGSGMGIEESSETWTRVDLFCDGIGGDSTTCVAYGDPNDIDADFPMVTDCCPTPDDARRLTLHAATEQGWQFDLDLRRWLCPACVEALRMRGRTI
jgi:hypothetical protein